MSGKTVRIGKLFSNGNAVVIAMDHGSYMGPFKGCEYPRQQILSLKKADAVLVMPGVAKQCADFFADKESPLCIIRLNWATHYCTPHEKLYAKGLAPLIADVKYAVSLGADMVMVSLLLGTDEDANTKNVEVMGKIVVEADSLGIPLIGEYIPAGGIDRYTGDLKPLLLGTRACAEFGSDIIKTVYCPGFDKVAGYNIIPTLALGGGAFEKPADAYKVAASAIREGAKGIVFGRNVICAENPAAYLEALIKVVKHDMSPQDAENFYYSKK